jgi:TRAP-type uncharacterized transport system fused permease subunit
METQKPSDRFTPDSSEPVETISEEKVSELIEEFESEAQTRDLKGMWRWIVGIGAALLSLYALYWTQYNIGTYIYRPSFLAFVLGLSFLIYPFAKRDRKAPTVIDVVLTIASVVSLAYLVFNYETALQRIVNPTTIEIVMGSIAILMCLEATRRTTGIALPLICVAFLLYGLFGNLIPGFFGHRGYRLDRIVGQNYLTLEGLFGVPLDVAATFIVLFTIYGAVLEYSGAGKFFLDWAFAALGKSKSGAGPGRTVTMAGFLLGTVSGSGVATTVTLGALAWPMLKKAGYNKETAGGILSAAGIGATLSPPTLGAAAFIIAEYLKISYLDVLIMAMIPTILYYLSCFLMIEFDSRRMGTKSVETKSETLKVLTLKYGYHFTSLFLVAVLMAVGLSAYMAVFWSIFAAFMLSFLRPETRMTSIRGLVIGLVVGVILWFGRSYFNVILDPLNIEIRSEANAAFWAMMVAIVVSCIEGWRQKKGLAPVLKMLEAGGKGTVSIAATTAVAGIIVSVITLTGLGTRLSGSIVDLAGGNVLFTILFAALALWVLGLAVPVTASYIIARVMIWPALTKIGVPEPAADMFIFYYAVLADVTPPTALAPSAAAALTGGKPYPTMMMAWKYCLPAFLVPIMFTISPEGASLLLVDASGKLSLSYNPNLGWIFQGNLPLILQTFVTSCIAVVGMAIGLGGWILRNANIIERVLAGVGGLLLLYASTTTDLIGLGLLVVSIVLHVIRTRVERVLPA